MSKSLTAILAALVVVMILAAAVASSRLAAAKSEAVAQARDLAAARADLADLDAWHVTTAATDGKGEDASDLNRRIRAAAAAGGLVDRLARVDPGPTVRLRDTETTRTPIYLRLDGVSLRRLTTFVHALTRDDASLRVTGIDLTAPAAGGARTEAGEIWDVDLTLSQTGIAPPDAGGRE